MQAVDYLKIHPEVKEALLENRPVVALESTIISHGMPYPRNVETALEVEQVVRQSGAVPATIAVKEGFCHVGLSAEEIDYFGKEKQVWKVSLRDMPYVVSKKLPGATTVAATMRIASMEGIKIFATGGIGGVHRGAASTFDISADLTEMAKTSVAVISAGIKSILDIGLTLEVLETLGIPVISFRQDELPGFYTGKSGFLSPQRLDDASAIADLLHTKWSMGLQGSVLIANPVPEKQSADPVLIERHIQAALTEAERQKISGKSVTPFLLKYIAGHSEGESLESNIALIRHNAALASSIAVALASR